MCGRGESFLSVPTDNSQMETNRVAVNPDIGTSNSEQSELFEEGNGTANCKFQSLSKFRIISSFYSPHCELIMDNSYTTVCPPV